MNEWFIVPQEILDGMELPSWFPSKNPTVTEHFTNRSITVHIDKFRMLTYDQRCIVYLGLIRSAHKKSLQVSSLRSNPHFKMVFSFKPFTPPWFLATINCLVNNRPVFSPLLTFDHPAIPQKKQFRSRSYTVVGNLQGVIAAFYSKEPRFAAATIDYLMNKYITDPTIFRRLKQRRKLTKKTIDVNAHSSFSTAISFRPCPCQQP